MTKSRPHPMQKTKKLAVAMTALSVAAVVAGIGAAKAQAQSEVLTGTATTISGSAYGNCLYRSSIGASANFNAAGSATGPYPGTFTETSASAGLSGYRNPPWQLRLHIPFTINSDNTTITGTITTPYPSGGYQFAGFLCNGSAPVGFLANTYNEKYTATIQSPSQPAQTISGSAAINGSFYIQPGAQTTFTETLAFP